MPVEEIARQFSVGISTLRRHMSKMHLLRRPGQHSVKYKFDEDYFDIINDEHKAYWLGVLYADGCLEHIKTSKYVVWNSIDKSWIESFKRDIQFTGPILKEHHSKYNKDIWKIKFTSKKMYFDLIAKGMMEKKSKVVSFPDINIVPGHLMHHFVRGYFDGNGSVGFYQNMKNRPWKRLRVSFCCGSESFIKGLTHWIEENTGFAIKIKKRKSLSTFIIELSTKCGFKLRDIIYKDATVYLQRKHDKYFSA